MPRVAKFSIDKKTAANDNYLKKPDCYKHFKLPYCEWIDFWVVFANRNCFYLSTILYTKLFHYSIKNLAVDSQNSYF